MSDEATQYVPCSAAANQRGEHIPCDKPWPHGPWPHSNKEHELVWRSDTDALGLTEAQR